MIRTARAAAPVALAFLLAGCAGFGSDDSKYWQILKQAFANSFGDNAISRDQASAIPYSSLGYRYKGGPEFILVLATDTNGQLLWTASTHVVLLTQDGRVVRTTGLPQNLGGLAPMRGPSLPAPATALEGPSLNYLAADFPDTGRYSVPLTCRLSLAGRQTITVLGQSIATNRVDENCQSPGWNFRNSYWLDQGNKFVWRSVQNIHPGGDTLEIEIFRPPG